MTGASPNSISATPSRLPGQKKWRVASGEWRAKKKAETKNRDLFFALAFMPAFSPRSFHRVPHPALFRLLVVSSPLFLCVSAFRHLLLFFALCTKRASPTLPIFHFPFSIFAFSFSSLATRHSPLSSHV